MCKSSSYIRLNTVIVTFSKRLYLGCVETSFIGTLETSVLAILYAHVATFFYFLQIGHIRFFDASEVSYYFKVNPENNKHFGYIPYALTIPYTITVKLSQRFNVDGYRSVLFFIFLQNEQMSYKYFLTKQSVSLSLSFCFSLLFLMLYAWA